MKQSPDSSQQHPLHIGMRTGKTALSIFILVWIYNAWIGHSPMLACLSAVYSQKSDLHETRDAHRRRTFATMVGGFYALLCVFLTDTVGLPYNLFTRSLLPTLCILAVIVSCNALGQSGAVIAASATYLVIYFNIPSEQKYLYAIERIADTFIGGLLPVLIEWLLPKERTDALLNHFLKKQDQDSQNDEEQ